MPQKASEGPESRRLFVNREALIAEFLRRVHSNPSNAVLFLFGEGGIGKSSLLDQFEEHYARCLDTPVGQFLDPWVNLSQSPPRQLVHQFLHLQSHLLPCARINFWEKALGKDPREAFFGLQAIRKRLKLPAPLFQAACVLYVHGTEGLSKEWMVELFPGDRTDFAVGLLDQPWTPAALAGLLHLVATGATVAIPAVGVAALVRGLWGLSASLGGTELAQRAARRKLGNAIQDLASYKPHELLEALPRLLAEDINASMEERPNRIVLLFDAYDRFIGSEHFLSSRDRDDRDVWFRSFLKHLRLDQGAVVVVTGQEPPAWGEDVHVDAIAVDYLSVPDARRFIVSAGVEPEARRESLIRYASLAPDQVQPLFLALLVDTYRLASERGAPVDPERLAEHATVQHQQKAIVDRLLTAADADLKNAIAALAACRSFDWRAFHALGENLSFANFQSKFDTLTGLSCVRRAGQQAFVMHSLIRRFLGAENAGLRVHKACHEYYSTSGRSIADAVYHEYFIDKESADHSWGKGFKAAARLNQHQECGALLSVRQEMPASFAIEYSDEAGAYLMGMSRYEDAEREFSIAANYWSEKTRGGMCGKDIDPDEWNRKGLALQRWGDLQALRRHNVGAQEKYNTAVEAFDRALTVYPNHSGALDNKGIALNRWATLLAQLSDHTGAEEKYAAALEAQERALALTPNAPDLLNNHGNALSRSAQLRAERGDHTGAEEKYLAAVTAHDRALALAPNDPWMLNNQGVTFTMWATLQAQLREQIGAEENYNSAVRYCDRALAVSPNYMEALNNRSMALQGWANLRVQRNDYMAAEEKYGAAVEAYDLALALAPNDPELFNNKGGALVSWARLRVLRSDHGAAEETYGAAVETCDRALVLAPNYANALRNKGTALREWALMKLEAGEMEGGCDLLQRSSTSFARSLEISPHSDIYLSLASTFIFFSKVIDGENGRVILHAATQLCNEWEASFPWDEKRITSTREMIEAEKQRLDCN